ncbi:MAG: T9SS type A sorting domain-containing protein [Bacteroidetes bacterium]|nr:T9SS type A sorting domain-containing protein [Bacteroidota bacterium]
MLHTYISSLLIPGPIIPGVNGYSLFITDTASHHQWYKDGILIPGAISDTITAFANGCYSYSAWDIDSACSTHSQTYCYTTIGIEEKTQYQFQLYPNPAQEYVWITHKNASNSSKMIQVKLFAYDGSEKEILIKPFSNNQWILNTSKLTNGIYLVQIGAEIHRIIINK